MLGWRHLGKLLVAGDVGAPGALGGQEGGGLLSHWMRGLAWFIRNVQVFLTPLSQGVP